MAVFVLPDLGEGLQDAEIVAWHVAPGERVVADQPLLSVETDKAVVEIPAPHEGTVTALHGEVGDKVEIGATLVEFEAEARADSGVIVGELPTDAAVVDEAAAAQAAPTVTVKAAPAVRAKAAKLGIDLAMVAPSGPGGSVTAADVDRAEKTLARAGPAEQLRGVRRAMARRMAQAQAEIAPATVSDEADVDHWGPDEKPTPRLIRAVAAAARAEPALNAWYDSAAGSRRLVDFVDLGLAVHNADGLFVPVLRDVGGRDADDLLRGLEALKNDVDARSIPAEELRGATITLSNYGVFGAGRFAAMVIVPPQVAIVGAGRIRKRPAVHDGKIVARRLLPLSLTFDHRVVNGGEAAGFLTALIEDLQR